MELWSLETVVGTAGLPPIVEVTAGFFGVLL
jgi:hypothetical protein